MEIIMENIAFVYWDRNGNMLKSYFNYNYLSTYNPETHELVEKKESKIKRLTQEIQDAKELLEAKSKFFDDEILKMKQLSIKIEELEKELKEAEK